MSRSSHISVNPRYSPGSPAMNPRVSEAKFIATEREFYEAALSGLWGADEKARAERLGLAPASDERGTLRAVFEIVTEEKDWWAVYDVVNDVHFRRPFHGETLEEADERVRRREARHEFVGALTCVGRDALLELLALEVYKLATKDKGVPRARGRMPDLRRVGAWLARLAGDHEANEQEEHR